MTESGKLCMEVVQAFERNDLARDKVVAAQADQSKTDRLFTTALNAAVEATGMDYNSVIARGLEELRLMEASEG